MSSWTLITPERIAYLAAEKGIDPAIACIDLEKVKMKLMETGGPSWTHELCESAEVAYKRFLHLSKRFPNCVIVPDKTADEMWHEHILDTRAYRRDCDAALGEFLHHRPYVGAKSELGEQEVGWALEETRRIYLKEFGEDDTSESLGVKCGAKCAQCCFPAGTSVLVPGMNTRPIEEIEVGDVIMCFDGADLVEDKVDAIEAPVRDHLYSLTFEHGPVLRLTDEHPLYTSLGLRSLSPGSTEHESPGACVGRLAVGDMVKTIDGYSKVTKIDFARCLVKTYNLRRLLNYNCYYVNGALAHNKAFLNSSSTQSSDTSNRNETQLTNAN